MMRSARNIIIATCSFLVLILSLSVTFSPAAQAAYNGGRIIDDSVFLDARSMSLNGIRLFLQSKGGGIAKMLFTLDCQSTGATSAKMLRDAGAPCGQNVDAATIIYYIAQIYGVNPQVILATMQKEQSLVTTPNPTSWQVNQAMGYGCPDNGSCNSDSGFLYQIDNGTWLLRFHMERARGNMSYWSPSTSWTCGSRKDYYAPNLYPHQNVNFYDDNGIMYRTHYIENASTSSFYCYTPHAYNNPKGLYGRKPYGTTGQYYSGSYNFVIFFERWFGSTHNNTTIISFRSHLSRLGWVSSTTNQGFTGTTGQSRAMEALRIDGPVEYSSYAIDKGWTPTVNDGMITGTIGQSRGISAVRVKLKSSLAAAYDIYYRVHVSNVGWMDWASNGQPAGVEASKNSIEAIEFRLVKKGEHDKPTVSQTRAFIPSINSISASSSNNISTNVHISNVGWQNNMIGGFPVGVTDVNSKAVEALSFSLKDHTDSAIHYSAHVSNIGWQDYVSGGSIAGTTGQSKSIEAIRIYLSGPITNTHSVWYRAYVRGLGWLDWTSNNLVAGSVGVSRPIEAYEVQVLPKGESLGFETGGVYNPGKQPIPSTTKIHYSAHVSNIGWQNHVSNGSIAGTTGHSKSIEAIRVDSAQSIFGSIPLKCNYVGTGYGWRSTIMRSNSLCGTTGEGRALRALQLSLPDNLAKNYTLEYRVHLARIGWQPWVGNNSIVGFPDDGQTRHPIEALQIRITDKER